VQSVWAQSAHAPLKCDDCHNPHGVRDRDGVIPSMLAVRQPDVCTGCHDGSRAADIRSQLSKSYVHGTLTRHADCSDCHNVHQVIQDPAPSSTDPSNRLAGVSRVQVVNGGAGVVPAYRLLASDDPGEVKESEVCFKCHSSYVKQPLGQSDLARLTNPANPSFHPIQAAGKNPRIDPRSFVNDFGPDSTVTCSNCHGSDDATVKGPHGSAYRYLLKKSQDDLCFDCHSRDTYIAGAPGSRFEGHALHAGAQRVACFACHETHGSVRNAALIATGRFPGITTYTQTPMGGTCTSNCHTLKTYSASYPR
jgi:predicted CXXCH cytochrome family protein